MLRIICIVLSLTLCISVVGFAGDEKKTDAIPNLTQPQTPTTNGNGVTVDLGADKDGVDLNPTERTVIIRDAVRSNRAVINPPSNNPAQ